MEDKNVVRIVDEVTELCAQYAQEVPSRRRTWPKSIKDRVLQLLQLELSCDSVANQTGIPVATIYSWKMAGKPEQVFLPVKVVQSHIPQVEPAPALEAKKAAKRRYRRRLATNIIVIAPSGIRFEGLDVSSALQIAERLGLGL